MKKSVIVLLFIVYIASIVFINIFGMKLLAYNKDVYATSIECINTDMSVNPETQLKTKSLHYAEGLTYLIEHRIYPENVSIKTVEYLYDSDLITISDIGVVSFLKKPTKLRTTVTVTIKTTDKTNVETKIALTIFKN